MTGILAPVAVILNLIFASCISLILSQVWADIPTWGVLGIGTGVFFVALYVQDFFFRSKSQQDVLETLNTLQKNQQSLLNQVDQLQSRQPGAAFDDLEEDADPRSVSRAVLSEIKFMQSLIQQISDYHQKSVHQPQPSQAKPKPKTKSAKSGTTIEDDSSLDPHIEDIGESKPLSREELLSALQGALKSDRIEMLVQPIVSLPQRKRRHVECFSRIKDTDGSIIVPDHYIKIAQDESLISIIDNTLIFRCIQMLRTVLKKSHVMNFFCNISTYSLKSDKFVDGLIEFFKSNPRLARHITFELDYYNLKEDMETILPALKKLAARGCHFSLDKIDDLSALDIKVLKQYAFKFIKVETAALVTLVAQEGGPDQINKVKKKADKAGIDIILTKVEEESQLVELLDLNFDFGQGYLFGTPKLSNY